MIRFSIAFAFLLMILAAEGQKPVMYHYTTEDGIPGSEVFDISQDEKGYIWIATNNGISKFNGKTFKTYNTEDGLPDNSCIELFKDDKGRIWMTSNINQLAYIENNSIYAYKYNDILFEIRSTPGYSISSLFIENDAVYFGWNNKGIFKINPDGKIDSIYMFTGPDGVLYKFGNNNIVYAHLHFFYINYKTKVFEKDSSYMLDPSFKQNHGFGRIKYAQNNNLTAVSFDYKLLIFDGQRILSKRNFDSDITKIKFDSDGNLLVCTYKNGLHIFFKDNIDGEADFRFLPDKTITSVYKDNADGYWISTMKNGLYYIPTPYFQYIDKENGLRNNYINNLVRGKNDLWFSDIKNQVGFFDGKTIEQFDLSGRNSYHISDLVYDKTKDQIWGCINGGYSSLFRINKINYQFYDNWIFIPDTAAIILNTNICLRSLISNDNSLLIGHTFGLYEFTQDQNDVNIIYFRKAVHTMSYGKSSKELWFGNMEGLFKLKNKDIINYGNKDSLFKKRVVKLVYQKEKDALWVATKSWGIYVLKNNRVITFNKTKGLSSDNVTAFEVNGNNIWVGTTNGLDQITIENDKNFTYRIKHYNENKGLISNIINDIEVDDSIVYIATDKGISFFNYNKIKKNSIAPPIYITKIKINGRDTVLNPKYVLSHDQNTIEIFYDGLNYTAPKELSYQYQLEGLHTIWRTTQYNQLEFSGLANGKYTFKIYAVNEDGVKSGLIQEIEFRIRPPFYKSWWFISSASLIVFLLITGFFRYRIYELKKRNTIEKKLIKERQKALSQQMNPHFIFNTLSSIQYYLYKKDKISSSIYLEKFAQLMRNTLYNSQKDFISIHDEIQSLKTYIELEQLRLNHEFEYKIEVDETIDLNATNIPCFLIQPYIENAIWHGIQHLQKKGELKINMALKNNYLICEIDDNGIGRASSEEINKKKRKSHTSLAGKITDKRVDLINILYKKEMKINYIDKTNEKGFSSGTTVILSIPVFYI